MFCRNCGKEVSWQAVICPSCGVKPYAGRDFCQSCGQPTDRASKLCLKCGVRLRMAPNDEAVKSKLAAGLFGVFLGGLGIHRFYLGFIGTGIAQIIITAITLGVGGLWGFIEGILILAGAMDKDAQSRPLR